MENGNGIRKGKLVQFAGSWGSGLGFLAIEDSETGIIEQMPCDNGQTVRSLEDAFGGTITDGHTANGGGYKGKEVYYSLDAFGLVLEWFVPVDGLTPELEAELLAG